MESLLRFACLLAVAVLAGVVFADGPGRTYTFGRTKAAKGLVVCVVSSRAGLTFADGEAIDLAARVEGAAGPAVLRFDAAEAEGPWTQSGKLDFAAGETVKPIPLKLPGRGMYTLKLSAEAEAGAAKGSAPTSLAVLFPAGEPTEVSPWGIFYIRPLGDDPKDPAALADSADNLRRLGASWVRLNWWAFSYGQVTLADGAASADSAYYKQIVRELRRRGLFIMGEFAQVPRALSSRPKDEQANGDAGPLWCRVKPADYALWDSMVERMARDFAADIGVWEVSNEPDLRGKYWSGTLEEFVEFTHHTAAAVRKGNPKARVAVSGFTGLNDFAMKALAACAADLDIVSFHYTDADAGKVQQWRSWLDEHGLKKPMWNTEERSEVPLRNLAGGVERSFKFIHANIGYGEYRPLVELDLTPRPSGVWFSVGAHCIGDGRFDGHAAVEGCEAFFFRRGGERVGVFTGGPAQRKLFDKVAAAVTVRAEAVAGEKLRVIDKWGREKPLRPSADGMAEIEWTCDLMYVRGASRLELVKATVEATTEGVHVFEAEKGKFSAGWAATGHEGFSEGRTVDIYASGDPPEGGYWVELKLSVPTAGRYELLFAGNGLARLKDPASLSPFVWTLDGGPERAATGDVRVIKDVPAAPEGLSVLGEADLKAGEHTFRLRLTARRAQPDTHYALWFDALALRPVRR